MNDVKPKDGWVPLDTEGLNLKLLSNRYVEDRDLKDPPSRLFRSLMREMGLTAPELIVYINDYLKWEVDIDDPKRANEQRTNVRGNIKTSYFNSDTMTMPKLLNGLSILKAKRVTFVMITEFHDRPDVEVRETIKIHSAYGNKKTK